MKGRRTISLVFSEFDDANDWSNKNKYETRESCQVTYEFYQYEIKTDKIYYKLQQGYADQ